MSLRKSIFFNYFGVGVSSLLPILSLPWYVKFLGISQWGLLSAIAVMQTILCLLDGGISQVLMRQIALYLSEPLGAYRAAELLRGIERVYWVFGICVGAAIAIASYPIAVYWMRLDDALLASGQLAVVAGAGVFAAQLPGMAYRSVLSGSQAHATLNTLLAVWVIIRHGGGVAIAAVWPRLEAYLAWQFLTILLETVSRRIYAWRRLNVDPRNVRRDFSELRKVVRLLVEMSGTVLLGSLVVHLDKLILVRMAPIDQFGYYAIAAMLAMGVLQLISPLTPIALPKIIGYRDSSGALLALNLKLIGAIFLIVVSCGALYSAAGRYFLDVWLQNAAVVDVVFPILSVLLIGTALNAFYNVGYLNWLARAKTDRIFIVNGLSLALAIIFIPKMIAHYGTIGAAFGWLMINLVGFLISLEWLVFWKKNEKIV